MQVIILEDEIPAFNKLSNYLLAYAPHATIIAWYRSVEDALNEKEKFKICDLILSDIKLIDGTSMDLFLNLEFSCPIIFCTAYNKYLQDAFETNGIAYLIKPYSKEAFHKALQKYKQFFGKENQSQLGHHAIPLIEKMLQKNLKGHKQRFSIRKRDGIIIKQVSDIVYFQACGDFCTMVCKDGEKHNASYKVSQLVELLDPDLFFRINRSEIVNIAFIQKVSVYFKNKMQIALPNETVLMTSGARTPEFRLWLDGK